jgi:general secretion pathway protein L
MTQKTFLKNIFRPRTVVGLHVTTERLALVKIVNTLKGPEVVETRSRGLDQERDVSEQLKALFDAPRLKYDMLVSSIPSPLGSFRRIPVPFQKSRKLERIIRYQLEPYIPSPIDGILVDYFPGGSDGNAVVMGLEKKILSDHLKSLKNAGLEPDLVVLDEAAIFSLYTAGSLDRRKGEDSTAIVHFGEDFLGMQIVSGDEVRFVRILSDSENSISAIDESLKIYELQEKAVPRNLFLVGNSPDVDAFRKEMQNSSTGMEVNVWDPWKHLRIRVEDFSRSDAEYLVVPLGAALIPSIDFRPFNFRKDEFSIESVMEMKRKMVSVIVLLFLLGGAVTFHLYQKEHLQGKRYQEVKRQVRNVFLSTFPDTVRLVKGQELAQMRQKMAEERSRLAWTNDFRRKDTVLAVLKVLTEKMGPIPDLYLEDFAFEGKEVTVEGETASFETVEKLKKAFQTSSMFTSVKLAGAKKTREKKRVRFQMKLMLK